MLSLEDAALIISVGVALVAGVGKALVGGGAGIDRDPIAHAETVETAVAAVVDALFGVRIGGQWYRR